MAKYYCMSGSFRLILDETDELTAVNKFLNKAISKKQDFGWVVFIGETGFSRQKMFMMPCVPLLRKIGKSLPEDDILLDQICMSFKLNRDILSESFKFWILHGEDFKNEF